MSVWDAERENVESKAVADELEEKDYHSLWRKDVRDRRDNRSRPQTEELSTVIGFIQNAIERACLAGGEMFKYDAHAPFKTLLGPLDGITSILHGYESNVLHFSEKVSRLEQYADFDMKTYDKSDFKTDHEKYHKLKHYVHEYGPIDEFYTSFFSQFIDGLKPTTEELTSLVSLLDLICREGNVLHEDGDRSPHSVSDTTTTDSVVGGFKERKLTTEDDSSPMRTDTGIVDLEDYAMGESESEAGLETSSQVSSEVKPKPKSKFRIDDSNEYEEQPEEKRGNSIGSRIYYDSHRNEIRYSPDFESRASTPKASVANTSGDAGSYVTTPRASAPHSPAPSDHSTVRPNRPSPPPSPPPVRSFPQSRAVSPNPYAFNYPSPSPHVANLPGAINLHWLTPRKPIHYVFYQLRLESPNTDPTLPTWKRLLSAKHPVERLSVSDLDITVFRKALKSARKALKQAEHVEGVCNLKVALAFQQQEIFQEWEEEYQRRKQVRAWERHLKAKAKETAMAAAAAYSGSAAAKGKGKGREEDPGPGTTQTEDEAEEELHSGMSGVESFYSSASAVEEADTQGSWEADELPAMWRLGALGELPAMVQHAYQAQAQAHGEGVGLGGRGQVSMTKRELEKILEEDEGEEEEEL